MSVSGQREGGRGVPETIGHSVEVHSCGDKLGDGTPKNDCCIDQTKGLSKSTGYESCMVLIDGLRSNL